MDSGSTPILTEQGESNQLPSISGFAIFGLLMFVFLSVSYAQQVAAYGEDLYNGRLRCRNCHGRTGEGGSGPSIANTQSPLRNFAKYMRLPNEEMPAYSPRLTSDTELAIPYHWLEGADAIKVSPWNARPLSVT